MVGPPAVRDTAGPADVSRNNTSSVLAGSRGILGSVADRRGQFYEAFAEQWDDRLSYDELDKRLRLVFTRLLSAEDLHGKLTLDAGAGTGHFSRDLAARGARVISLDVGTALLGKTRARAKTVPVCCSVLALPFPDRAFEVVLCTEVIEHTTDPRAAVRELCRVVAPGGVLVVTTPNRVWKPAVLVANALRVRPYAGYENWSGYRELRRWIDGAGLLVETHVGFNLLPHTRFCRPRFDVLDGLRWLHPWMINIAVRARRATP